MVFSGAGSSNSAVKSSSMSSVSSNLDFLTDFPLAALLALLLLAGVAAAAVGPVVAAAADAVGGEGDLFLLAFSLCSCTPNDVGLCRLKADDSRNSFPSLSML